MYCKQNHWFCQDDCPVCPDCPQCAKFAKHGKRIRHNDKYHCSLLVCTNTRTRTYLWTSPWLAWKRRRSTPS